MPAAINKKAKRHFEIFLIVGICGKVYLKRRSFVGRRRFDLYCYFIPKANKTVAVNLTDELYNKFIIEYIYEF